METHIKKIEEGRVELTVELGRDELKGYIDRVQKEALANVQIDGFRKGKVPEHLGKDQLDASKVLQAALEEALEKSLAGAIEQEHLDVFKVSDLAIKENSAEKLQYTVAVTLFPNITLPDLAQFKVTRKTFEVDDKEITETLDVIRNSRSTFAPKQTAAETGDRVEVDFDVVMDGKPIEGGASKNHPLIIGGKNFIPGFEDQLAGMKNGEEKSFSLTAPADYYQKDLAGKKLDFKVTMKTVQSVLKPELNDEFAKTLGKFENVDQLKGGVREGIYEEKRQKEKQRVRLEVLDKIIAATEIKLPEAFIEEQLNAMLVNFEHDLTERGMEIGMYLAHIGKTQDDLRKEWRTEAERQAKIAFIIHRIARDKGIAVTDEEVNAALNQSVQALIARGQVDPSQLNLDKARQSIIDQLRNEKTLDFIEGVCAA